MSKSAHTPLPWITAVNNHQELLTRLYNLVNACETMRGKPEAYMEVELRLTEARELIKKLTP